MAASLELAISAIRSGRTEEGRQLLNLLIQRNPNDEMAWLWMSSVVGTDEQRARCLYHVLAINPNSELARRGLQLLGIVVSDSRPVKIPRDSQPIQIPNPSSQSKPWSPPVPKSEAPSEPTGERRPFRIDPQAIVDELPFKPITHPFNKPITAAASEDATGVAPDSKPIPANQPAAPARPPSNPVPVSQADIDSRPAPRQAEPSPHPSEPVPAVRSELGSTQKMPELNPSKDPSEPVSPVQSQADIEGQLRIPGSINLSIPPDQSTPQGTPTGQQPFTTGLPHETRPSQPIPVPHSQPTVNMPQQMPYPGQGYQQQYPSEQMPVHSNVTMGMPAPYFPAQHPSQSMAAVHSNATLGMPMQAQPAGPMYQQPYGQNPAIHSNSTMAMPLGYDPFVAFRNAPNEEYRVVKKSQSGAKRRKIEEEEDGEEINILAVIIFGSLSITALGGLGMLILLMFTTG